MSEQSKAVNTKSVNKAEKNSKVDNTSSSVASSYEPPTVTSTENLPPQCSF